MFRPKSFVIRNVLILDVTYVMRCLINDCLLPTRAFAAADLGESSKLSLDDQIQK